MDDRRAADLIPLPAQPNPLQISIISVDRTETLTAAAHLDDRFQDLNPNIELYPAQTGQLLLPLEPESNPQFQP